MHTMDIAGAPAANHIFTPDMSWTRDIPAARKLDCVAAAEEMFAQAERKLGQVERTGLDRGQIRVAAFLPRLPHADADRGSRRYASYMGKKFRQHGLDFRVEEATHSFLLTTIISGR